MGTDPINQGGTREAAQGNGWTCPGGGPCKVPEGGEDLGEKDPQFYSFTQAPNTGIPVLPSFPHTPHPTHQANDVGYIFSFFPPALLGPHLWHMEVPKLGEKSEL